MSVVKAGLTISPRVTVVMMSAGAERLVLERWSYSSQFVVRLHEGVGHALMVAAITIASSSESESTFFDCMMIVLVE